MTAAKRAVLERKFPSPVQFIIRCPQVWMGQTQYGDRSKGWAGDARPPPQAVPEIRWHWDQLFSLYNEWVRDQQIGCGVVQKAENLIGPLRQIGIYGGSDSGRVHIKPDSDQPTVRDKGFKVKRNSLISSIRKFLDGVGEKKDEKWEPPQLD